MKKYRRTLVIGDIHGSIEALEKALQVADFHIEKDRIICIGDYVDRWDHSFEVVERLLEIKKYAAFKPIFLLGNHDNWFLYVLHTSFDKLRDKAFIKSEYDLWYYQGGRETRNSYISQSDEDILRHKWDFYNQLKLYHLEDNKLFVHAGFSIEHGFQYTLDHEKDDLFWNRELYKYALQQYRLNEERIARKEQPIDFNIGGFEKIYIGHSQTSSDGLNTPRKMGNVINVDQGCKKRNVLTIWIDETDEYFQSDMLD